MPKGKYVPIFSLVEPPLVDRADDGKGKLQASAILESGAESRHRNYLVKLLLGLALVALTFIALSVFSLNSRGTENGFDAAVTMPFGPALAISPFDIIKSGDNDLFKTSTLRDGLHFELVDKMSRFKDIFIVMINPDGATNPAIELSVVDTQYLLSGSIQRSADAIRINAVLSRLNTGEVLWTRTFNETITGPDVFLEIQEEIATSVAVALGQPYSAINTKFLPEYSNLQGDYLKHYYCLMKFYAYMQRKAEIEHAESRTCLEAATRQMPNFSSGWAALSRIYADEEFNGFNLIPGEQSPVERAVLAANRAVDADSNNAMAYQYLSVALFLTGDKQGFRKAAETALRLNPNDAYALSSIGMNLIRLENSEAGKAMVEKAMAMNPSHPIWHHGILGLYHYVREETEQSLLHVTQFYQNGGPLAAALYAAVLVQDGRVEEAKQIYMELVEKHPKFGSQFESIFQRRRLPRGVYDQLVNDLQTAGMVQSTSTP